ncbi:MAG: hypothetical protein Q8R07_02495 [Candidatus Uhrbacteria bacterium]|nr:hypothetical protein [Candidatus Uhrbacteria bacterium]
MLVLAGITLVPGLEIWSTRVVTGVEGVTGAGCGEPLAPGATGVGFGASGKLKADPA